ncbi:energy-coupling factor transporter transmembrane component T [Pseudanabaena sp. FACHB-2040]|uniref:energy-coupling factor transporter transmembrane component T family protein n=1 Tax=Pseudanabaena sp. FACHB-2040 TaxID=2692859 RepID=UPI0016861626|nr:energy-coupling factor transporter transmembrane component T [Pseudanabaena sp. FACHB-2040]MBD2257229.1 energy-coupling factor transporter transmembrane protein EcfT [Pseudanabaena sp. FACHB-2040]
MTARVPVLYRDYDTVVHDRDPRVKILLLLLLFFYLFVAPTWQWMLVPVVLGFLTAVLARTPWKWLAVLWAIHLPTFIVLMIIPAGGAILAGDYGKVIEVATTELRLILAWTAAIVVSISLLSTMDPNDLTRGLRGLRLPGIVAFAVGLSYRLLYTTLAEAMQISKAMQLKGVELDTKNIFKLVWNSMRLSLPILFAVLRRAPTLMATLETRGFGRKSSGLGKLNLLDWIMLLIGVAVLGLALADRVGGLPDSWLPWFSGSSDGSS